MDFQSVKNNSISFESITSITLETTSQKTKKISKKILKNCSILTQKKPKNQAKQAKQAKIFNILGEVKTLDFFSKNEENKAEEQKNDSLESSPSFSEESIINIQNYFTNNNTNNIQGRRGRGNIIILNSNNQRIRLEREELREEFLSDFSGISEDFNRNEFLIEDFACSSSSEEEEISQSSLDQISSFFCEEDQERGGVEEKYRKSCLF